MNPVSSSIAERARKNERIILQRLSSKTQTAVALELNTSESTISRLKNEDLSNLSKFLAAIGLKVVAEDSLEISQTELLAMETLAFKYLQNRRDNCEFKNKGHI